MDQLNKSILQKIHSYNDKNEEYLFKISFNCHYCDARLTNRNLADTGEYHSNYTYCYKVRCLKCNNRYFIKNKGDNGIEELTKQNTRVKIEKPIEELRTKIFSDDEDSEEEGHN